MSACHPFNKLWFFSGRRNNVGGDCQSSRWFIFYIGGKQTCLNFLKKFHISSKVLFSTTNTSTHLIIVYIHTYIHPYIHTYIYTCSVFSPALLILLPSSFIKAPHLSSHPPSISSMPSPCPCSCGEEEEGVSLINNANLVWVQKHYCEENEEDKIMDKIPNEQEWKSQGY